MPKINRKQIIVVLIVITLIVTFFFWRMRDGENKTIQKEPFSQTVDIPNYFNNQLLQIENDIKESDFEFPTTLSYLNQQRKESLTFSKASKIALALGIDQEPIRVRDVENGEIFIWNGENYSLSVTPKTGEIDISSTQGIQSRINSSQDSNLATDEYQKLSAGFLTKMIGLNSGEITLNGVGFFDARSSDEHLNKSTETEAQVIQFNYSASKSEYPILTTSPEYSQIYVQMLKNGSVLSSKILYGNYFEYSQNKYPIKNFKEFNENLDLSIIVSIDNGEVNIPDLIEGDLGKITINEVEIAYLLDKPQSEVLLPVFLIKGEVLIKSLNEIVDVSMYLPAFR